MNSKFENENLMSLDDIIKKRKLDKQLDPYGFHYSKFVGLGLNEFVKKEFTTKLKMNTGNGRFDRPSLRDNFDNESDSDEEKGSKSLVTNDGDIEMKNESNEHINSYETLMDPDNRTKTFETIEQVNNIKVSSQGN